MKEFTVAMSLCDYIPVVLFAIAVVFLQRDFYNKMSKGAFALFAAGTVDVFCAGALKATYKLLYALSICDFQVLSDLFFPLQAIGFLLAGVGMVAMLLHPQARHKTYCFAVAASQLFKGTMLFVLSFLLCLTMGYLSSRDFTREYMNWIAEGINILGQGLLLAGALYLHKAGLKEYSPIE